MKELLRYLKNYKLLTFIGTLSMVILIAVDMFNPYLQQLLIDNVITNGEFGLLPKLLLATGAITLVKVIFGYAKEFLFDYMSTKVTLDIKQKVFDHIQSLSFSYFDGMNTGELMSRIGEDAENVWRALGFGLRLFIENIVYFVIATGILFYINWQLALVAMITMPFIAYITLVLEKKLGDIFSRLSDHTAVLNTTAQENIAGVRLVKAFAREKHEILKFLNHNEKYFGLSMEQSRVWRKYYPIEELLSNVTTILVTCVGGIFVIKTQLSLGTLVAFAGYIGMLIWPMRMMGWLTNILAQSKASAKKLQKILNTEPAIKDAETPVIPETIKGDITFENVSFSYNEEEVLQDINIAIPAGSTVAVMGGTGSGKSSLVSLLGRGYEVSKGTIKIDGIDIKDLALASLRGSISIVPQESFLFSDTIENNIRYGQIGSNLEEIKEACTLACASEFIDTLPEGYDTLIGERGMGLSGGQKQRLCIARALVKKSPILILDDSTSALDMETEYQLLKNLYHRGSKTTTFIIAHRISAVKNADIILYMEDGKVVEIGNHEELLAKKGRYYEIYKTQFKDFLNEEKEEEVG